MRAGKLDRTIVIERATTTVDDYGTPAQAWTTIATVKAQLIQSSAEEFIRNYGAESEATLLFRVRYREGFKTGDRVTYEELHFEVKEIKELGRREGLELWCIRKS